jgi:hypothetical protein
VAEREIYVGPDRVQKVLPEVNFDVVIAVPGCRNLESLNEKAECTYFLRS